MTEFERAIFFPGGCPHENAAMRRMVAAENRRDEATERKATKRDPLTPAVRRTMTRRLEMDHYALHLKHCEHFNLEPESREKVLKREIDRIERTLEGARDPQRYRNKHDTDEKNAAFIASHEEQLAWVKSQMNWS